MVFFFRKRSADGKKPGKPGSSQPPEPTLTIVPPTPEPPAAAPTAPAPTPAAQQPAPSFTPPLEEWSLLRLQLEKTEDGGLALLEGNEQGVHSASAALPEFAVGRSVRIGLSVRSIDRTIIAVALTAETTGDRAQAEIILDLQRGVVLRSNVVGAEIVASEVERNPEGWTGVSFIARITEPGASAAAVSVAVRKSPNGSTAYQGENLKSVEIRDVRVAQS